MYKIVCIFVLNYLYTRTYMINKHTIADECSDKTEWMRTPRRDIPKIGEYPTRVCTMFEYDYIDIGVFG